MDVKEFFIGKAQKLFWQRLPADHLSNPDGTTYSEKDFVEDQAYFIVRLKEMYLRNTRILLRKYYPMLHSYVEHMEQGGTRQENHGVSGPGQLMQLGDASPDRLINLNTALTDITPYKGGDVDILVGLYSIPGQDAGSVLISTLSGVASLAGLAAGQAVAIANLVKTGIEGILNLDKVQLQLGIRDSFYTGNPFRSGYYLGVKTSSANIDPTALWLRDGRLVKGPSLFQSKPYEDYDYMVLELEWRDSREDWPRLPGINERVRWFERTMANPNSTPEEKRDLLRSQWHFFQEALNASPFLVGPDRQRIAKSMADDLVRRIKAMMGAGTPFDFETRGWKGNNLRKGDPMDFDVLDVTDTFIAGDSESIQQAKLALEGNPFSAL